MQRDDEIARLIKYAQGMGITVRFKPYIKNSGVAAEWATDGTEINIYTDKSSSKIGKVLLLIHELSHHKAFVDKKRQIGSHMERILDSEEHTKEDRKKVYDMEYQDSAYWEDIYRDTHCKFNIEKLRKQREFDVWQYEVYYKTGKYPNTREKKIKMEALKELYGC